ncbi:MAG: ATP-binding protein [Pseudomonadota bacterium]
MRRKRDRQKLLQTSSFLGALALDWSVRAQEILPDSGIGAAIGDGNGNAPEAGWFTQLTNSVDPLLAGVAGMAAVSIAAIAWATRVSRLAKTASSDWSFQLADLEARLQKSESVLSAHPGLVLVWEDDDAAIDQGWGSPKMLGGPAALASLMALAKDDGTEEPSDALGAMLASPADRLLETLGDLILEDDGAPEDRQKLKDRIRELRRHGIAFSGAVYTGDGRAIEIDGRVAGDQVALWLTDPAVRMAEDDGILGRVRQKAADLHGALAQLQRAPIPAWRRTADGALDWVNAAYVKAVEADSAITVLKEQRELDSAVRRISAAANEQGRPNEGRVAVNIGGARRMFKVAEIPMSGSEKSALFGFAVDITELEKTRSDLTQHQDANRRTLDQMPAPVAIFGSSKELVFFNSAFKDLFGFDEAELSTRPSHGELLDRLRQRARLPEVADFQAWKRDQLALYTDDLSAPGVERHGEAPDDIWHLPNGRVLRVVRSRHPLGGVIVIFDDVTENLRLEALYNTQIKVQRATLNNLSEGVATFSADGTLRLHNDAFRQIWRLDDAELNENTHIRQLSDIFASKSKDGTDALGDLARKVASLSPEDRTPLSEAQLSLTDGRTLAIGTEPLPDGATLVRFLDVTDSKEREKELRERNALLEDIDRQKTKFVDHVSYQLRTPLNTIIGFAEMVDGEMFGVLNERQKDYVASILSASYTLKDLISDIMDLAALDAGKMSIDREDVDIRELITNAATYAALKAEDTQVSLTIDCEKEIGSISADARRLKQVLFNLLSNAFAYTGAGGSVKVGADKTPGLLRLWVEDTGRGVSPEDQAKAFDSFESSGPSAGAGLGLALVHRLVTLHGGWVRMESAPDEGTRVTCYLPTGTSQGEKSEHDEKPSVPHTDESVVSLDQDSKPAAASATAETPAANSTAENKAEAKNEKAAAAPKKRKAIQRRRVRGGVAATAKAAE